MRDIESREDIDKLVADFYTKVLADPQIGYLFTEVAKINLDEHLPVVADFWEMLLFRTVDFVEKYERTPMSKHVELDAKSPFAPEHFLRWLDLFYETLSSMFEGPKAELARNKAAAVATAMMTTVMSRRRIEVEVPE